jgi:hypothetical protein
MVVAIAPWACTFNSVGGAPDSDGPDGGTGHASETDPVATSVGTSAATVDPPTAGTATTTEDTGEAQCPGDWWDQAWASRARVTIDNAGNGTSALDVPVAVRVDLTTLAGVGEGGFDLRFVGDDGQILPTELERGSDPSLVVAWVRVPEVPSDGTIAGFWLYYGNPDVPRAEDPAAVWAGYQAVWHLSDVGGTFPSSTSPAVPGMPAGATAAEGRMAGGVGFAGNNDILDFGAASFPLLNGWGGASLSMWVYFDYADDPTWEGSPRRVLERGGGVRNGRTWREDHLPPGVGFFQIDFVFEQESAYRRFEIPRQQWHWVVYDYDGGVLRLYLDGELQDTHDVVDSPLTQQEASLSLGGGEAFSGRVDELRTSYTSRSPDWYALQYASMIGDLVVLGPPQACP